MFGHHLFVDGFPEAPGPHRPIEALERLLVVRLGEQARPDAGDGGEEQDQGKAVERRDAGQSEGDEQRTGHARNHPPEIPKAVEPPPVPFQHVRRRVAPEEPRDDPQRHLVDRLGHQPEDHAEGHHQERGEVADLDVGFLRSFGTDVALVEVVDQVGRPRVDRRVERRHEGGQQTGQQQSHDTDRQEIVDDHGQDLFEVDVAAPRGHLVAEEDQGQDGHAGNHEPARHRADRDEAAHHGGFLRGARRQHALHVVIRRRPGHAHEESFE